MNVEICRLCKEVEWTHELLPKEKTPVEEDKDVLSKLWDIINIDLIVEVFWSSDEYIEIKNNWLEIEMSNNSSCDWLDDQSEIDVENKIFSDRNESCLEGLYDWIDE